jgi:hypothetical protein
MTMPSFYGVSRRDGEKTGGVFKALVKWIPSKMLGVRLSA